MLVAALFSVVLAYPATDEEPKTLLMRQETSRSDDDDYFMPPPNSPESEAKAKVFANAYHDYIKSLGTR